MSVSSYETGTRSSGVVRIIEDLETNVIEGRDVSGCRGCVRHRSDTCLYSGYAKGSALLAVCQICSLLKKRSARKAEVEIKYLGKEIPDVFVVGYGLDYNERYRNLPHIAKLLVPDGEL